MTLRAAFPHTCTDGSGPVAGTIITLPDARLVEIAALAGCRWALVDCEHGAVAVAEVGRVLAGAPEGFPVLVRVPTADEVHVKQALDAGAAGVVCPMVEDSSTVRSLVRWAKYPPLGARSVGIGRAHGYGIAFAPHLDSANARTSVVVQIESEAGVAAIDEILAVDGLGGVFIGPYDLSADMGHPGNPTAPEVVAAVGHAVARCNAAAVPVGQFFATSSACSNAPGHKNLDFAAIGLDTMLLAQTLQAHMQALAPRS